MNSDPLRVFGRNLFQLRKSRGLTQEELAERAEISVHHLSDLENGLAEPGYHVLKKLRKALDYPWAVLMGEQEPEPVVRLLHRSRREELFQRSQS